MGYIDLEKHFVEVNFRKWEHFFFILQKQPSYCAMYESSGECLQGQMSYVPISRQLLYHRLVHRMACRGLVKCLTERL